MGLEQLAGGERERTLIVARRTLTEPEMFFAGVIFEIFFARFEASMAMFNAEMAPSLPSGRWDPASMVMVGSWGRTVRLEDCEEGSKP